MDSAAMFTLIGVAGGLVLAVAAAAVSYNEYLYRKARGETDGPWCICCSLNYWRSLRQRLGCPGKPAKKPDEAVGGREVRPYLPPFKESVDCMFLVQRLKKEGLVDTAGAKRLSDVVASRDPRLLALVRKHTRNITADTVLTRNAEFQASFVLLSKSQKLPRVDEQRLIREAQEKKDAEAKAKAAAEREAARKWKAAAKEARESQLKELAEGSSSEEEPPQGTMSWRHV